jgi:ATP-dependent Clp protease ATP-binding subunit ClpA
LTDDAQQAIELAFTELAHTMDCRVGTGHLLLGVARQQGGAGRRTLTDLGVDVDQLRGHESISAPDGVGWIVYSSRDGTGRARC